MGLSSVFDKIDIIAGGQRAERVEVAGATSDMDADNSDGSFGDGGLRRSGVDIVGIGFYIGEDGDAPGGDDGTSRGDKGVGRDDDLVTGAYADGR